MQFTFDIDEIVKVLNLYGHIEFTPTEESDFRRWLEECQLTQRSGTFVLLESVSLWFFYHPAPEAIHLGFYTVKHVTPELAMLVELTNLRLKETYECLI